MKKIRNRLWEAMLSPLDGLGSALLNKKDSDPGSAEKIFRQALDLITVHVGSNPYHYRAIILRGLGEALIVQGTNLNKEGKHRQAQTKYDEAQEILEECLHKAEKPRWEPTIALALHELGRLSYFRAKSQMYVILNDRQSQLSEEKIVSKFDGVREELASARTSLKEHSR